MTVMSKAKIPRWWNVLAILTLSPLALWLLVMLFRLVRSAAH